MNVVFFFFLFFMRVWECIQDGTLVAMKKLDKPIGKKEFITEVPTIGSMHRMNLVRLYGYCSEGSHQYAFHFIA